MKIHAAKHKFVTDSYTELKRKKQQKKKEKPVKEPIILYRTFLRYINFKVLLQIILLIFHLELGLGHAR